ncbi:DNA-processing protein DprA [Paenibacillus sp. TRM 82003]|nr:DNA-processing protein DprA [Paenibacillus sp. TRM 82003]
MTMEERDVMLGLCEMEGIGWESIQIIVDAVEDLKALLETPATTLLKGTKISKRKQGEIETVLTKAYIAGKLRFYEERGVVPITFFEPAYPPLLRYIHKPPWVLYAVGDVSLLQRLCVSVVGTRHPTYYGREVAEWLGAELASAGIPVVSGLARGIDGYAHAGALGSTGATIAVLGNGLNLRYPPEHYELQRAIAERGLVLTEYRWNARPSKGSFPWRNRIIAGLSRGTVVVEAAARSGSLLTAEYALAFGRDVFAVPGLITSPKSAGAYRLIREGAKLVTAPSDVVGEYVELPSGNDAKDASPEEQLTAEEAELLSLMGAEAATVDELMSLSGHTFGHLHSVLLSLLVKKRIRALPGSQYIARMI